MKAKTVYDKLSKCVMVDDIDHATVYNVLEWLKDEIRKDIAKDNKDTNRLKYAMKVLKNKASKSRPILQKAVIRDNKQVFTDSYILFRMNKHISGLLLHDEKDFSRFPNIDNIIDLAKNNNENSKSFMVQELNERIAVMKKDDIFIDLHLFDDNYIRFDKDKLSQAINVLGFKNKDTMTVYYSNNGFESSDELDKGFNVRATYIKNDNDDECILLPCRVG